MEYMSFGTERCLRILIKNKSKGGGFNFQEKNKRDMKFWLKFLLKFWTLTLKVLMLKKLNYGKYYIHNFFGHNGRYLLKTIT